MKSDSGSVRMKPETEFETRRDLIDVMLKKAGWDPKDITKVIQEVDTKQSDFKARDYKTRSETLKTVAEKAYADYLLLDSGGSPLAVIEAKRTTKDPVLGQEQAEEYADDIKKQTGKDVFIFLTNGFEIWFWNRPNESLRMVKGYHSLDDLERIRFQNASKKNLRDIPIDPKIVDRPYQLEAVKRVTEGIEKGRRKFLIVQATGTGKTRVAMAIIDVMMKANRAKKVLFLADRKALRDQAYNDGVKVYFPHELKDRIFIGTLDKNKRLFASTIQTFMDCYQEFSIGEFDLIISDESHRSIYNKWKDVFTYFDSIEIGLTATPADLIDRNTYRFFDCEGGNPTVLYTYEKAVDEKYLAQYNVYEARTHFQISGIKPEDVPNEVKKELVERGIEPEDINFEGTDIERKVAVIGTNEAIVKEFMENCVNDVTGTLPAKTIFFAVSKKHAKRLWEAFNKLYPEYKGELARYIISEDPRAQQLLKKFKKENMPRIAISVDMLDTGIDVPEVCNLAFVKPVFSKIKFWQMIGRGSRADAACVFRDWLPSGKKEDYLIFDFWKVFDWFGMHPEGREAKPTEAVPAKIFLLRVRQLEHFMRHKNLKKAELVKQKILHDIGELPKDSVAIKDAARDLEQVQSPEFWKRIGVKPLQFLRTRITPLLRYKPGADPNRLSFELKTEQLGVAVLEKNKAELERLKEGIGEIMDYLPFTIKQVKEKERIINEVQKSAFWRNVTYEDAQMLLEELAPLMKYKRTERRPPIVLDIDDVIQEREYIDYGPLTAPKSILAKTYMERVEKRIKELAEKHPTIQKIMRDESITEGDLQELEKTLNSPELYVTEETLQKVFKQPKGTLVEFIKKILGLYEFPDPEKKIDEAFKTFMIEKNYLNADQVNFMRTIETVFSKKHHIEYGDLFEPPFTNFGPNAPVPLLQKDDLDEVLNICRGLETEVFTHAGP
jgi:type I restriction enzyme R subunit